MHIESGYSRAMKNELFRSMFEERKRVFVDLLRWDVPVLNDCYEVDQFDDDSAIYIVITGRDGRHAASARLLPTLHSHILDTIFPELCAAAPPRGSDIFEITRFCLSRELRAKERLEARNQLISALVDYAINHNIRTFTGVAEWSWFQQILSFGWVCHPLGLPSAIGGHCLVSLQIEIDGNTPKLLKHAGVLRQASLAGLADAA